MSEKYTITMSITAKNDLKSLVLYIKNELKEPKIASRYSKMIKSEIKKLEDLPQRFVSIDDEDMKDLKIRKLIIKNYIAFYRINEEKRIVTVERILYDASNWSSIL